MIGCIKDLYIRTLVLRSRAEFLFLSGYRNCFCTMAFEWCFQVSFLSISRLRYVIDVSQFISVSSIVILLFLFSLTSSGLF